MIRTKNICYQINDSVILENINFFVPKGETFVIMGPSGCGKSTLLRIIARLMPATSGQVFLGSREAVYYDRPPKEWLKPRIGLLFQSAALFDSLTVGENVAFGLRRLGGFTEQEIVETVKEKLAIVGLSDDDVISKMPSELSGGMKKRVGLARAIAIEPEIILYDEPTTGLDPIMANVINQMIRHLQKTLQVTSLVVTHDLNCASIVGDKLALLYNKNIVESAIYENFIKSDNPIVQQFLRGEIEGPINLSIGGDFSQ